MSLHSPIQWCDGTANPVMGCEGCELWQRRENARRTCYAGYLHERYNGSNRGFAKSFDVPEKFPGRMEVAARAGTLVGTLRPDKPWLNGMPRIWFVSDMGDALSKSIDFEYLHAEIIDNATSHQGRRHVWLWLTKQPKRMVAFYEQRLGGRGWPSNVWVGTSITAGESIHRLGRIDALRRVGDDTTTRFLSVEPQLEKISLANELHGIGWVIQGGESEAKRTEFGTPEYEEYGARPFDLDWARALRDECRDAGVPFFLKQLGSRAIVGGLEAKLKDRHGGDWNEWPEDLRVREVPRSRVWQRAAAKRLPLVGSDDVPTMATTNEPDMPTSASADAPPTLAAERAPRMWTVGYERRTPAEVIEALQCAGVGKVIDVRLAVISSRKPDFAREALDRALSAVGVEYVHRPRAGNPYYREMKRDPARGLALFEQYIDANTDVIDELVGLVRARPSALLCIEADAARCHRDVLVERLMQRVPDLTVVHLLPPPTKRAKTAVRHRNTSGVTSDESEMPEAAAIRPVRVEPLTRPPARGTLVVEELTPVLLSSPRAAGTFVVEDLPPVVLSVAPPAIAGQTPSPTKPRRRSHR